jgi:hypothetical protein
MNARLLVAFGALVLTTAAFVVACSSPSDDEAGPTSASATATAPAPAASAGVPPGRGTVIETMNSGGYTYVNVDLGGLPVWVAGPEVAVKVGDTVTIPAGMAMRSFRSGTLNRTFDIVYFVSAIQPGDAPASPAAAVAAAHQGMPSSAPAPAGEPVAKLDGGQTVEEVVTKRADFAGQDVAVRGRVVKFNAGILGANWIHLQDGTGSAGTNDLTVTTDATVAVGDVVVVRGKVVTDKDFGSGYKYAVIVEKAAVSKE